MKDSTHTPPFSSSQKFPKSEHLSSKKDIDFLFKNGKVLFAYPFKLVYIQREDKSTSEQDSSIISPFFPKVLISVPKRNFKKAVDRNRIKRQIREGYRLQKSAFDLSQVRSFAFICVAKEKLDSHFLHKKIRKLLYLLQKESTSKN